MTAEPWSDFRGGQDTVPVQLTLEETLALLKNTTSPFFLQFFMGEELEHDVPQFHQDTWELMNSEEALNIACALPRGTAKTTLARLSVIYHYLFTFRRYIIYVSATLPNAVESCKVIVDFLKSENFEAVFGRVDFEVFQDSRGFYKFWLPFYDIHGLLRKKYCILRALGAGQKIRGTNIDNVRPEMAVVDDLEDEENTKNEVQQRGVSRWFYGAFRKALTRKSPKIVYIGNMLSNKSLLYGFCHSDNWYSIRFGILLSSGQPLWPELWSLEAIRADFLEYQQRGLIGLWFAEMMNMPIPDGNLLINAEDIFYLPGLQPGEQEASFITVDPAISQKDWANDTAIVVHVLKNGVWRQGDYVKGKFTPDQTFMLLLDMCTKWRTRIVGIEAAGYQLILKYLFELLMQVHNQSFEIFEVPHKNKSKHERIAAWCSVIRKKLYALTEGDYGMTECLLQYDPAKDDNDDDLADSGSMFVTMTNMYMPAIMMTYTISPDQYRITKVVTC